MLKICSMKWFSLLVFCVFATACFYDSEEKLYPAPVGSCDTTNITYSGKIDSILATHCLNCHRNEMASFFGGNIFLEEYPDIRKRLDDGSLIGSISYDPSFKNMPDDYMLDDCMISQIRAWINAGAPNN
jgi:hypothetical protein